MENTPYNWAPRSQAILCRVVWDSSYKDVVRFTDANARDAYFDSLASESITIQNMTYLKPNEPIKVNIPYSTAYRYNYVVVENPKLDVPNESTPPKLYYFIIGAQMLNPSTTLLTLQLDAFQTYVYNVQFGRAFVERGHVGVQAAYNSEYMVGLSRYCTVPEGVDVGNAYTVAKTEFINMQPQKVRGVNVIIVSSTDLAADWGTKTNPSLTTANGQKVDGLISGCNVYMLTSDFFEDLMDDLKAAPWVAKGIISITAFPNTLLTDGKPVSLNGTPAFFLGETPDEGIYYTSPSAMSAIFESAIPDRYSTLRKLHAYPYANVMLSGFDGNATVLKPELMGRNQVQLNCVSCAAPPHLKIGMYPANYGASRVANPSEIRYTFSTMDKDGNGVVRQGDWLDVAVWMTDFPTFTIVNDNYTLYLASTNATRNYSYNAAGWSLAKSNAANDVGYDQASRQLGVNAENMRTQNMATVAKGALGAVGSLSSGNVGGALMGAASTGIDLVATNDQFQRNQANQAINNDQNYELSKWSARGDYEQAIASINATVQDAALTQPSMIGQSGGSGFNLSNGLWAFLVRYRTISYNNLCTVGEYMLRFGYAVHEFMQIPQGLMCMNHFTYWKMKEVYLTCAEADETAKDTIRGIFEKGVTVWSNPNEVGTLDPAQNIPLEGRHYG